MNRTKTTWAVAAALGFLMFSAVDAAAQAPVVTFQQNGSRVLINWNAIPGATGYLFSVTGTLTGQMPVPTTFLDVTPPPGTYVVTVSATAPGLVGPPSAPVTIIVGGAGAPCAAPGAPDVTVASGGGMAVIVTWPGVPGASGYRVQVGRGPGVTEFSTDLSAAQTSFGGAVPFVGTYYIRVLAGSACGAVSTSTEKSITVGAPTPGPTPDGGGGASGTGPRAADPQPGVNYGGLEPGLLPMPSYAEAVTLDLARRFPVEVSVGRPRECGTGANNNFLYRLTAELRKRDTRFGNNLKRGHLVPNNTSEDIITYNPTAGSDDSATQIYLSDIIGGECFRGVAKWDWFKLTQTDTWGVWFTENRSLCANRYCARWSLTSYLQAGWPLNP